MNGKIEPSTRLLDANVTTQYFDKTSNPSQETGGRFVNGARKIFKFHSSSNLCTWNCMISTLHISRLLSKMLKSAPSHQSIINILDPKDLVANKISCKPSCNWSNCKCRRQSNTQNPKLDYDVVIILAKATLELFLQKRCS